MFEPSLRVWLALLGALACFTPQPSSAQAVALPLVASSDYSAVIREALQEFEDNHFAEARALFARAHELQPSARTWRGLGLSAFELRDYEDAVISLEQALVSSERPLDGELRTEASTLLERAYGFVGRFVIGMAPPTAQLVVDDVETGLRPADRLLLSIGRHRLEARAPAYEPDRRSVDVTGGENTGLSFTLVPLPAPVLVATPSEAAAAVAMPPLDTRGGQPAREQGPERPLYRNPWLWAGVSAAAVAIAVVIGVAAAHDKTALEGVSSTRNTPANGVITLP
ncbi:MAG: hypothetical protein JWN48_3553 [Myxococcaceae bacterium]|nr:hypothetical protein [Myxococcaceae bacterium]